MRAIPICVNAQRPNLSHLMRKIESDKETKCRWTITTRRPVGGFERRGFGVIAPSSASTDSRRMWGFFLTWVQTAVLPSSAAAVAHRDRAAPPRSAVAGLRGALWSNVRAETQPVCFLQPSDTHEFTPEHICTCIIRFPVHQSPIVQHNKKKNN